MGRLNKVLDIDDESGLARIQAGALGPDIEEQLSAAAGRSGTSRTASPTRTLGGWVATRSSGMQSDKYGDIADITRGVRVVMPGEVLVMRPLPSTSTGPSVREMILGSRGSARRHHRGHRAGAPHPEEREILGYLFPSWDAGLAAMQEIADSDAAPSVTRVSDADETAFSFATRRSSKGFDRRHWSARA